MSIVEFSCLFCNTKMSEFFDMANSWAARLCRLPKQVTGSAERLRYLKSLSYNSVAELRYIKKLEIWYKKKDHPTNIEVYRVSPNYRK